MNIFPWVIEYDLQRGNVADIISNLFENNFEYIGSSYQYAK